MSGYQSIETMNMSKPHFKLPINLFRFHNGGLRFCILILLLFLIASSFILLMLPNSSMFFSYTSWRNVSMYHIFKMHLSGRPTHVTPLYECKRIVKPPMDVSHLNLESVKFYEDIPEKMEKLGPNDAWKKAFHPLLDRETKISLLLLYGVLQSSLNERGIPHLVLHGTAIGAWRHHGLTPWDDDIDLVIDMAHWVEIREILSCIEGYTLDVGSNSKWAFYKNDGHVINGSNKRWPFLDLFLYTHDDEYAWALNYVHLRKFVFKKEDLFPAQLVPFECFLVPAPRHLRKVLEHQYVHPEVCTSHYMDHRKGLSNKAVVTRPCSELSDLYSMYFTNN